MVGKSLFHRNPVERTTVVDRSTTDLFHGDNYKVHIIPPDLIELSTMHGVHDALEVTRYFRAQEVNAALERLTFLKFHLLYGFVIVRFSYHDDVHGLPLDVINAPGQMSSPDSSTAIIQSLVGIEPIDRSRPRPGAS